MLIRNQLLLAKVESVIGVDALPVAGMNAIACDLVDENIDAKKVITPEVRRSISEGQERTGRKNIIPVRYSPPTREYGNMMNALKSI